MKRGTGAAALLAGASLVLALSSGQATEARYVSETVELSTSTTLATDDVRMTTGIDATTFVDQSPVTSPGIVVTNEADTGDMVVRLTNVSVDKPPDQFGSVSRIGFWTSMNTLGFRYAVYAVPGAGPAACVGAANRTDAVQVSQTVSSFPSFPARVGIAGDGAVAVPPNGSVTFCPTVVAPASMANLATLQSFYMSNMAQAAQTTLSFESALPGTAGSASTAVGLTDISWGQTASASVVQAVNIPFVQPEARTGYTGAYWSFFNQGYDMVRWHWPTATNPGQNSAPAVYGLQVLYRPTGTVNEFRPLADYTSLFGNWTRIVDTPNGMYRPNWTRGEVGVHYRNWSELGTQISTNYSNRWEYGLDLKFRLLLADSAGGFSGYYVDSPFYYETAQTFTTANPTLRLHKVSGSARYTVVADEPNDNLPAYFDGWGVNR